MNTWKAESMANPQTEDGFLKIANEIAEALARLHLSGNQWRVLMVVLRQTYGWSRKDARITVTQFQQKTGLHRRHVSRELTALISRNIVTKNGDGKITSYRFQKDFSKWQSSPKMVRKMNVTKNGDDAVTKNGDDQKFLPFIKNKYKDRGDFSSEIPEMEKRYPDQEIILQAFQAIAGTRKSGKIADSIRLKILQTWAKYPTEQVLAGIKTFIDKGYAAQGKNEKYLLGIIRNLPTPQAAPTGPTMKRSGSPLLDTYYREQGYTLT